MASLGFRLFDPALVDLHRVCADADGAVLQHLQDGRAQDLLERVVTASVAVETHQHLDDRGVPRHDLLGLVHFQSGCVSERES